MTRVPSSTGCEDEAMTGSGGFQRVEMEGLTIQFVLGSSAQPLAEEAWTVAGRERVDHEIAELAEQIRVVDGRVERLTNHSDRLDCAVAVGCGVLAGIVDSLWVGEFSLTRAHEWGADRVNEFVLKAARTLTGYEGNDLATAIRRLEQEVPFAGDKATRLFGGPTIHHLRDLTHHPSPVGLVASIVMQFTGQAWGVTNGSLGPVDVGQDAPELIGTTVSEKFLFGTIRWVAHLVSDVAGSSTFAGAGTGLPGPLLSTLHEAGAAFGRIRGETERTEFLKWVEGVFRGDRDGVPFDLRTELGIVNEAGRQALPVLLTETLVRAFYFVRRASEACREAEPRTFRELLSVDLRPALPWGNRTVTRMLTVASSTFTAVDLLDAGIRAAVASGGDSVSFSAQFLLRVNFVGVVRTSVAIGVDVRQGTKRSALRNERIALMNQQLQMLNARASYRVGETWLAAGDATTAVRAAEEAIALAGPAFMETWTGTRETTEKIEQQVSGLRASDPAVLAQALEDLEWGVET